MKVHSRLLHRKSANVRRISPTQIELERAAFKADKLKNAEATVPEVQPEAVNEEPIAPIVPEIPTASDLEVLGEQLDEAKKDPDHSVTVNLDAVLPKEEVAPEKEVAPKEEVAAEKEVAPEPPKVPLHLLTMNSSQLSEELATGNHDAFLSELLKTEEAGRNRKGVKSKLEDRIIAAQKL